MHQCPYGNLPFAKARQAAVDQSKREADEQRAARAAVKVSCILGDAVYDAAVG